MSLWNSLCCVGLCCVVKFNCAEAVIALLAGNQVLCCGFVTANINRSTMLSWAAALYQSITMSSWMTVRLVFVVVFPGFLATTVKGAASVCMQTWTLQIPTTFSISCATSRDKVVTSSRWRPATNTTEQSRDKFSQDLFKTGLFHVKHIPFLSDSDVFRHLQQLLCSC